MFCSSSVHPSPLLQTPGTIPTVLPSAECYKIGMIKHVVDFSEKQTFHGGFSHLALWAVFTLSFSVVFVGSQFISLYHWVTLNCIGANNLFIHSPIEGHIVCFQFLTIMNKACINILVQVFSCVCMCVYIKFQLN